MENTILKKVKGFEDFYLIDSNGNVYSKRKWRGVEMRKLTPSKNEFGYFT